MSVIIFCPSCGASAEGERTYCPCCGASLRGDIPKSTVQEPVFMNQPQNGTYPYQNQSDIPNQNPYGMPQQPYYQQGYGMYNQTPLRQNTDSPAWAITGLILGILSIYLCCLSFFGVILGIAGIIFSCIGLRGTRCRGCAVAGLVCSITGTLMALVETIIILME